MLESNHAANITGVSNASSVGRMTCCLSDQSRGRSRFVLPDGGQLTSLLVVASKAVDTGFNENQTVLGVLVLAVAFKMLANGDSLLDQVVQVFGNFGSKT